MAEEEIKVEETKTELETAKDVEKKSTLGEGAIKAGLAVLEAPPLSNILKIIIFIFSGIGMIFFRAWIKKERRKAAKKLTQEEREKLQDYIREIDRNSNDGEFNGEDDL